MFADADVAAYGAPDVTAGAAGGSFHGSHQGHVAVVEYQAPWAARAQDAGGNAQARHVALVHQSQRGSIASSVHDDVLGAGHHRAFESLGFDPIYQVNSLDNLETKNSRVSQPAPRENPRKFACGALAQLPCVLHYGHWSEGPFGS